MLQSVWFRCTSASCFGALFSLFSQMATREVATRLSFSAVIARGFRIPSRPINVNRPTEGIGLPGATEPHTDRAADVFAQFTSLIDSAGPFSVYVELHGFSNPAVGERIEIATQGINANQASRLRDLLSARFPQVGYAVKVAVEPADSIHYRATGAKLYGTIGRYAPAFHIELPYTARHKHRSEIQDWLVAILPDLAAVAKENTYQLYGP